ncbi:MAG: phosphatidylglycerophosphatase A [Pseudomonadota bacterium]
MKLKAKTALFLATGGYVGLIRFAPGTFGSVEGLFFCYLLSLIPLPITLPCIAVFILFSIWISGEAEKSVGEKDPGCVIIDEIAGMMVTMAGLPFTPLSAAIGFLFFRGFDILKPPPIRTLQERLSGGAGIVLDDVAAGIAANILLRLILRFAGPA